MDFYKKLSEFYDIIFPLNQQSVNFLKEKIVGKSILDLAAGTGNHSIAIAKSGYDVTATDLDPYMVEKILAKAESNCVSVNALQLAMEEIEQLNSTFSSIMCLGNSLVHLKSFDDVSFVIKEMHQSLQANGKLIIQIVNYDRILSEGITELPLISREVEKVSFRRTYKHVDNKIIFHGLLTTQDEVFENEVTLLPLTSAQLESILTDTGFTSISKFGSFKGEEFDLNSPALIVEAVK
jgi:glycine/sarcosine N-methyltransferase